MVAIRTTLALVALLALGCTSEKVEDSAPPSAPERGLVSAFFAFLHGDWAGNSAKAAKDEAAAQAAEHQAQKDEKKAEAELKDNPKAAVKDLTKALKEEGEAERLEKAAEKEEQRAESQKGAKAQKEIVAEERAEEKAERDEESADKEENKSLKELKRAAEAELKHNPEAAKKLLQQAEIDGKKAVIDEMKAQEDQVMAEKDEHALMSGSAVKPTTAKLWSVRDGAHHPAALPAWLPAIGGFATGLAIVGFVFLAKWRMRTVPEREFTGFAAYDQELGAAE